MGEAHSGWGVGERWGIEMVTMSNHQDLFPFQNQVHIETSMSAQGGVIYITLKFVPDLFFTPNMELEKRLPQLQCTSLQKK